MNNKKIIERLEKIEVIINRHSPMINSEIMENCAKDIYKEVIEQALSNQKQEFKRVVEEITLDKKQSTKIFSEIGKSYQALLEDSKYSAPEIIKEKIKNFWWGIYIRGRVDEKEDILKAIEKLC